MLTSSPHHDLPVNLSIDGSLPPGSRLQQGGFVVNAVLGRGGFGITYHAQGQSGTSFARGSGDTFVSDTSGLPAVATQAVAIKEFFPHGCHRCGLDVRFPSSVTNDAASAEQERARQNFLNEARVLAALQHPGIVRVYAAFEENNTAYMVMEFVDGETLQQIVERRGPLPEDMAVRYIEQIGAALSEVHRAHFIHRDIKAENIMVENPLVLINNQSGSQSREARVVLLDFGLNKEIGSSDTYHTLRLTNALRFGSPGYSPPEQYGRQARFGPYTDIYALGATLHYLLSGQVPPEAPERMAGEELKPLHQLQPQVSRSISDTVKWALELKGDDRPQTVEEFLNALRRGHGSSPSYPPSKATLDSRLASAMGGQNQPSSQANPTPTARAAFRPRSPLPAGRFPASQGATAQGPVAQRGKVQRVQASPGGIRRRLSTYAAGGIKRIGRYLWLNFVDILPHLLLMVLIAVVVIFTMQKQGDQKKPNQVKRGQGHTSSGQKATPRKPAR